MTSDYSNRQNQVTSAQRIVPLLQSREFFTAGVAIVNSLFGDVSGGSGISTRRIGSTDTIADSRFLMKSSQFAGVYGPMLRTTRTGGRPTTNSLGIRLHSENKLSIELLDFAPIKDMQGEWIANSNSFISKKQSGFLNSKVNRKNQKQNEEGKADIFLVGVTGIGKYRQKHSDRKKITQGAINAGTTRSKNNRISAGLVQSPEWSSNHE